MFGSSRSSSISPSAPHVPLLALVSLHPRLVQQLGGRGFHEPVHGALWLQQTQDGGTEITTATNRRVRTARLISLLLALSLVVGASKCPMESKCLILKNYIISHPNSSQIGVSFLLCLLI
jgi:hypothetical protein